VRREAANRVHHQLLVSETVWCSWCPPSVAPSSQQSAGVGRRRSEDVKVAPLDSAGDDVQLVQSLAGLWTAERERTGGGAPPVGFKDPFQTPAEFQGPY
jgi:hypothetical protein